MLQNDIKRQMRFAGFRFYIICFVYIYLKRKNVTREERDDQCSTYFDE